MLGALIASAAPRTLSAQQDGAGPVREFLEVRSHSTLVQLADGRILVSRAELRPPIAGQVSFSCTLATSSVS